MKTLETERLILRPFEEKDLHDFHFYSKDPAVGPSAGWPPHETMAQTREVLLRFMSEDSVWAMEDKTSHKIIGSVGLHRDERRDRSETIRMIGYALGKNWWGKGYMTEAVKRVIKHLFEEKGLDLITVYHFSQNLRSQRVIEKCGFRYEGTLRMASRLYDGQVLDDKCYSMTKEEYFSGLKGR
jgi:putative acetyltransferase